MIQISYQPVGAICQPSFCHLVGGCVKLFSWWFSISEIIFSSLLMLADARKEDKGNCWRHL